MGRSTILSRKQLRLRRNSREREERGCTFDSPSTALENPEGSSWIHRAGRCRIIIFFCCVAQRMDGWEGRPTLSLHFLSPKRPPHLIKPAILARLRLHLAASLVPPARFSGAPFAALIRVISSAVDNTARPRWPKPHVASRD